MGNKDKAAVATKSQQKRIFNEHLYFSHPRLNAQTAAAFLQRERGRCCRDQGWFRDHPWETPPTSSSPRFSPRCPAPASEFRVTLAQRIDLRLSEDTLKGSALPGKAVQAPDADAEKPELLFPRTLTESAPRGFHCTGNGLLLPGPQRRPSLSKCFTSWLCSCGHPLALHPALIERQLIQARLSPLFHRICI